MASTRLQRSLKKQSVRRKVVRATLVVANLLVMAGVVTFVSVGLNTEKSTVQTSLMAGEVAAVNPVDKLTTSDVAVNIARAANLPETTAIVNQAQSDKVAVLMSASDTTIAAKPQVVETELKSWRDIITHVVKPNETIPSLAQSYGISSDSIRWSNNLRGDALTVGATLYIPPSEGIVHLVVAGDTPQSLATKYRASADRISADNDAELTPLVVGRRAFIANGQIVPTVAPTSTFRATSVSSSSFTPSYGANGYDFGWCTYYAAARSGAPGNWGNANTWAYYARMSGWRVSGAPTAGAIFQTTSGWAGHVGIVEEVYPNGTMRVSDMNGFAGFGRVGYATVPVSAYPNYISR